MKPTNWQNAITNTQTVDKEQELETDEFVLYYTIQERAPFEDEEGYPVLGDDPNNCEEDGLAYAKNISNKRFFIKRNSRGFLFNPFDMYFRTFNSNSGTTKMGGRKEYNWSQVTEQAFIYYLNFLKTKNQSYRVNAEREM